MTIRHLRIFAAVYECGSTTAAAKKLFISQPSVSFAIAELENYYGQKLFDRISNRLAITEAGKLLLQYSETLLTTFDEIETGMRNWENAGILRVGTSITIGNCLLPKLVNVFKESHPDIKIQATISNSQQIEEYILNNEIDLGLIEGTVHGQFITSRSFMKDSLVFICHPSHVWANRTISPFLLSNSNFLLRESGSGGRKIFDGILQSLGIEVNVLWQSISTHAIIRAVEDNIGLSILPLRLVEDSIGKGRLAIFTVENISLKRDFYIIHHQNKFFSNTAKEFIKLCDSLYKIQDCESGHLNH